MKSWKALVCVLAVLAAVPVAMAQEAAADDGGWAVFNLGIGGQYWHADGLGEFDEEGMCGMNVIFRIRPVKYLGIDFRLGGEGVWWSETYSDAWGRGDADVFFGCVPAEAGLVLMLPLGSVLTLHGGGGVGYYFYHLDAELDGHLGGRRWSYDEEIDMKDDVGWYALAGASFRLCRHFSLFAECRYTGTSTRFKHPEDYGLGKDGNKEIDLSGVGVQAGAMFDF